MDAAIDCLRRASVGALFERISVSMTGEVPMFSSSMELSLTTRTFVAYDRCASPPSRLVSSGW